MRSPARLSYPTWIGEIIFLIVLTLLTFPVSNRWVQLGGDENWIAALTMIHGHTAWGRDVVFTYGPLSHFGFAKIALPPVFFVASVLGALLFSFLFFFAPWAYLRAYPIPAWKRLSFLLLWGFVLPFRFTYANFDYRLLTALAFFCMAGLHSEGKSRAPWSFLAFAVAGILPLVKFGSGVMGIATVGLFSLFLVYNRRYKEVAIGVLTSVVIFTALWSWIAAPGRSILGFVKIGLQLASTYQEAMSIQTATEFWPLQLMCLSLFALGLLGSFTTRQWTTLFEGLLAAPLLYYAYRHSWVRNTPHNVMESLMLFPVFLLLWRGPFFKTTSSLNRYWRQICIGISAATLLLPALYYAGLDKSPVPVRFGFSLQGARSLIHDFIIGLRPSERGMEALMNQNELAAHTGLPPEWIARIGTNTVDIMPLDISMLYAHGLNYQPRLTLLSYATYSPDLDDRTARQLAESGPQYLIWCSRGEGHDGRNALWDGPQTICAIRQWYGPVATEGNDMLLERRSNPCREERGAQQSFSVSSDTWIEFPATTAIAREVPLIGIDIQPTLWGKIKAAAYQIEPAWLEMLDTDGRLSRFRIVRTTANQGLIASSAGILGLRWNHSDEQRRASPVRFRVLLPQTRLPSYQPAISVHIQPVQWLE